VRADALLDDRAAVLREVAGLHERARGLVGSGVTTATPRTRSEMLLLSLRCRALSKEVRRTARSAADPDAVNARKALASALAGLADQLGRCRERMTQIDDLLVSEAPALASRMGVVSV
jgi:hypothetical protein